MLPVGDAFQKKNKNEGGADDLGGGFYQKNGDSDCCTCDACRNYNYSGLSATGQIKKGQFYRSDKTAFS